jgi:hypothetical protein
MKLIKSKIKMSLYKFAKYSYGIIGTSYILCLYGVLYSIYTNEKNNENNKKIMVDMVINSLTKKELINEIKNNPNELNCYGYKRKLTGVINDILLIYDGKILYSSIKCDFRNDSFIIDSTINNSFVEEIIPDIEKRPIE